MNAFDSAVSEVMDLSSQMKAAALTQAWDEFQTLDHQRQATLRLLRYDNYETIVSVEKFASSIESLLICNSELVAMVESCRTEVAISLEQFQKNRQAANAYQQL